MSRGYSWYYVLTVQRAALRYLPETCSWSTIGAIITFATLSVIAAVYLARRH